MHLSFLIHDNPGWLSDSRMLLYATRPAQTWYSHYSHYVRGRLAAQRFYIDLAQGCATLPMLHDTTCVYKNAVEVSKIGFSLATLESDKRFRKMTLQDPLVAVEDEMAAKYAGFAVRLVKHMLRNFCQYMFAFPHMFALLLHDDASERDRCLRDMQDADAAFAAVQTAPSPQWAEIVKRSVMNFAYVQNAMRDTP